MFKGKKIIAIGERDGAGYEVVFQATECFV